MAIGTAHALSRPKTGLCDDIGMLKVNASSENVRMFALPFNEGPPFLRGRKSLMLEVAFNIFLLLYFSPDTNNPKIQITAYKACSDSNIPSGNATPLKKIPTQNTFSL